MTGFAAVAAELPGVSLAVELRSVNHRYLDLQVRLPDELRAQESPLRERIAGELKRGKVECRISLNRAAAGASTLAVDTLRVGQLAAAARAVAEHTPGVAPLTVAEILRWPGVLAEPTVAPDELA
ncbi:MAG: YicC/YloC family endoribonuclease, partial [Betaproteobacteria bacterium]